MPNLGAYLFSAKPAPAMSKRIPIDVNPAVSRPVIADPRKAFGRGRRTAVGRFSTHSPIGERIRRLENVYHRI